MPLPLSVTVAEILAQQGWVVPTADDIAVRCQSVLATALPALSLPVVGFVAGSGTLVLQAESPAYVTAGRLAARKVIASVNAHFGSETVRAVAIRLAGPSEPTAPVPPARAEDPFIAVVRARQEAQAPRYHDTPLTDGQSTWPPLHPPATVQAQALARARADRADTQETPAQNGP
ncbi:hypothetical protein AB0N09_05445 [Streptomyces erythrochromogenes]|uniref:hypothetical protein n=1 Tax=Streptomyces erythrochromogenes TaxID=285574 RepID=UPI003440810E